MDALLDYTGYLLRTAFLRASAIAARRFEPGTHPRDAGVLITLINASRPVSQQELVERLNVNRTLMVKLIDSLEQRGLVTRLRNPDDRRAYALQPTPRGREALTEMLPTMAEAEAELSENLTADEIDRLKRLLRQLIAPPPDLGDRLGFLLSKGHHRFHDRADAELEPLDIQIRHFGALTALADGVPSQRALADRLSVSTPVVVEMVDALEARGLVERRRDPADRRSNALHVTTQGRETLKTATERLSAANQELTAPIGIDGDRELRSLLRKLLDA